LCPSNARRQDHEQQGNQDTCGPAETGSFHE
jgi:hypothetical protein